MKLQATKEREMRGIVALFSATLFLSAALMFTVQPMAGKMLMPIFGGTPSAWLTAMAFFQGVLVGGYALCHVLSAFSARVHAFVVTALLAGGLAFLPVTMTPSELPETTGALDVLALLAKNLTFPLLALSCLSPTLQRLFARRSNNPYFLFAASNLGSFGGLLAYPFVFELFSGLSVQSHLWRYGYGALVCACIVCFAATFKGQDASRGATSEAPTEGVSLQRKLLWVLYAFIPSSLMMGLTSYVTMDLGSVPFFWIAPLAIYLLTFVQAFAEKNGEKPLDKYGRAFLYAAIFTTVQEKIIGIPLVGYGVSLALCVLTFTLAARIFHALLAETKPHPSRLTEYYLWIAVGGALGGAFNAFLVPVIFLIPVEFKTVVVFAAFVLLWTRSGGKAWRSPHLKIELASFVFCAGCFVWLWLGSSAEQALSVLRFGVLVGLSVFLLTPSLIGTASLLLSVAAFHLLAQPSLAVQRNFFGVMNVVEQKHDANMVRFLKHGTTLHGMQLAGERKGAPTLTSYYGIMDDVFSLGGMNDVGIVGLGAGTLLCARAPERKFTVYEIDPDVVVFARAWFNFIPVCGEPTLRIGDGRQKLEAEKEARYDALLVDAFSSDAIPLHLLTREALALYMARTGRDGVVALHLSNRFYDLIPQISAQAKSLGFASLYVRDLSKEGKDPLWSPSLWAVLSREPARLEPLRAKGWKDMPFSEARPWTDDYSNLLTTLRFLP